WKTQSDAAKLRKCLRTENGKRSPDTFELCVQLRLRKKFRSFDQPILPDAGEEERFSARIADHAVFGRIALHGTDGRVTQQARVRGNAQPGCSRNGDARARVRARSQPDDDGFRGAEFFTPRVEIREKPRGILAVVRPLAHKLRRRVQPRQTAPRGGKFEGENFHAQIGSGGRSPVLRSRRAIAWESRFIK